MKKEEKKKERRIQVEDEISPIFRGGSDATAASRYESCNVCDRSVAISAGGFFSGRALVSHRAMDPIDISGLREIFGKGGTRAIHSIWEDTCRSCRVDNSETSRWKRATLSVAITSDFSKAISRAERKKANALETKKCLFRAFSSVLTAETRTRSPSSYLIISLIIPLSNN